MPDNAFVEIDDWAQAQRIADGWQAKRIHWKLDELAKRFCPIFRDFGVAYHWSLEQWEEAPHTAFFRRAGLEAIYRRTTPTPTPAGRAAPPPGGGGPGAGPPPTCFWGGRPSCRLSTATSRAPPSI